MPDVSALTELPRARGEALVDLAAIADNVRRLREVAAPAEVMSVVKADGYGHGMVPVAATARAAGATWLGTALIEEALTLRAAGDSGRVLALIPTPGDRFEEAVAADVDVSAGAAWSLHALAAAARTTGRTARVHLEVDTGLGRGGSTAAGWEDLLRQAALLEAEGAIEVVAVWSHFACSDVPDDPSVAAQLAAYAYALELATRLGVRPQLRHLANSGATLAVPQSRYDVVRPGIATYGLSPFGRPRPEDGLRPAMTVRARLAGSKQVPAGHGVSYGLTYRTPHATTLGLVPLGYGDGIPRAAGNRADVLVGGRRHRISGRVCMDQFVVDLESAETVAAVGEEVVLFGPGDAGEPTAQEWAEALDTINYEVVTRLGARLPRGYVGEPSPEATWVR
ncbi:MAG: alanine racemase [Actinomycetes bacterium]